MMLNGSDFVKGINDYNAIARPEVLENLKKYTSDPNFDPN